MTLTKAIHPSPLETSPSVIALTLYVIIVFRKDPTAVVTFLVRKTQQVQENKVILMGYWVLEKPSFRLDPH